jgi:hypothetical protein
MSSCLSCSWHGGHVDNLTYMIAMLLTAVSEKSLIFLEAERKNTRIVTSALHRGSLPEYGSEQAEKLRVVRFAIVV